VNDPDPAPAPAPASPGDSAPTPAPQERLRVAADRARARAKFGLLHLRYVTGYLAAGFGVSAPVTLGYQIYYGENALQMMALTGLSVLYGIVFLAPFLALEPLTRVAWGRMRVPEFRMFELTVSRSAALVSLALFVASLFTHMSSASRLARWLPPGLFWTVCVLMATAWAKIKAQVILFPEFYADRGGERVLGASPVPARPGTDGGSPGG
jgi:hypothetical protein